MCFPQMPAKKKAKRKAVDQLQTSEPNHVVKMKNTKKTVVVEAAAAAEEEEILIAAEAAAEAIVLASKAVAEAEAAAAAEAKVALDAAASQAATTEAITTQAPDPTMEEMVEIKATQYVVVIHDRCNPKDDRPHGETFKTKSAALVHAVVQAFELVNEDDKFRDKLEALYDFKALAKLDEPPSDVKDPIAAIFAFYIADVDEMYGLPDLEAWLHGENVTEENLESWVSYLEELDGERYQRITEVLVSIDVPVQDILSAKRRRL